MRSQQALNRLGVGGFGDVMIEAGGTGTLDIFGSPKAGHGDQQYSFEVRLLTQTPGHLVAVHASRQSDVEKHYLGPKIPCGLQSLATVVSRAHLMANQPK